MEFKDDPIAECTTSAMRRLQDKMLITLSGANYNRVFELVYSLMKDNDGKDKEIARLKSELFKARSKEKINFGE